MVCMVWTKAQKRSERLRKGKKNSMVVACNTNALRPGLGSDPAVGVRPRHSDRCERSSWLPDILPNGAVGAKHDICCSADVTALVFKTWLCI
jgi:hypothetical protein